MRFWFPGLTGSFFVFLACQGATAQSQSPKQIVRQAVSTELAADKADHTPWMFKDSYVSPDKNILKLVVQTPNGSVYKTLELNGRPLSPAQESQDIQRMKSFVTDTRAQNRQRNDSHHDDQQATDLLKLLPEGFVWTVTGESGDDVDLAFKPDPNFHPPSTESRVFSAMSGTMMVDARQHRIKKLSGRLTRPVTFGWGLFGRLDAGGTFEVIRRQVAPGQWQITQTHVHIRGHALFFKSIGDQEDEVTSDYKQVPPMSLQQATDMLLHLASAH